MSKEIIVIGSGLAGMSCAAYLGKAGYRVTVIEKNSTYGGRLQTVSQQGYTFDSGPSWYWMPDIFDSFFEDFDKKTNDYYDLRRINPGYRVYFSEGEYFDLVENLDELKRNFSKIEKAGGERFKDTLMMQEKNMKWLLKNLCTNQACLRWNIYILILLNDWEG